jgi:hypothetical protein
VGIAQSRGAFSIGGSATRSSATREVVVLTGVTRCDSSLSMMQDVDGYPLPEETKPELKPLA